MDFSLDGNGKLPPNLRDGIRTHVGAEGFQLPVIYMRGEILVSALKEPPLSEVDIDKLVLK